QARVPCFRDVPTLLTCHRRFPCGRLARPHLTGTSRLFRNAHLLGHWTKAAYGGFDPDPAIRARGTCPHLSCSKAASRKALYILASPSRRRGARRVAEGNRTPPPSQART